MQELLPDESNQGEDKISEELGNSTKTTPRKQIQRPRKLHRKPTIGGYNSGASSTIGNSKSVG